MPLDASQDSLHRIGSRSSVVADDDSALNVQPATGRAHPTSPVARRHRRTRDDDTDQFTWETPFSAVDERSSLLGHRDGPASRGGYDGSDPGTPFGGPPSRPSRPASVRMMERNRSRAGSFSMRLVNALGTQRRLAMGKSEYYRYSRHRRRQITSSFGADPESWVLNASANGRRA